MLRVRVCAPTLSRATLPVQNITAVVYAEVRPIAAVRPTAYTGRFFWRTDPCQILRRAVFESAHGFKRLFECVKIDKYVGFQQRLQSFPLSPGVCEIFAAWKLDLSSR